jgi:hypothetical protein
MTEDDLCKVKMATEDEPRDRDALGRRRREYFPRVHPMERYNDAKFQSRYRLPKELVRGLSARFAASPYHNSSYSGLPAEDRVRNSQYGGICNYNVFVLFNQYEYMAW